MVGGLEITENRVHNVADGIFISIKIKVFLKIKSFFQGIANGGVEKCSDLHRKAEYMYSVRSQN